MVCNKTVCAYTCALFALVLLAAGSGAMALDINFGEISGLQQLSDVAGMVNISYADTGSASFRVPNATILSCDAANTGCRQIVNCKMYRDDFRRSNIGTLLVVHPPFAANLSGHTLCCNVTRSGVSVPVYSRSDGLYAAYISTESATFAITSRDAAVIQAAIAGVMLQPAPDRTVAKERAGFTAQFSPRVIIARGRPARVTA